MKWEIYLLKKGLEAKHKAWVKGGKPLPFPQSWEVAPKKVKTCSFVVADKKAKALYPGRILYTREVTQ